MTDHEWVQRRSLGRRKQDRKWPRYLRDFWLFCITGLVLLALYHAQDATNRIMRDEQTTCLIQERGLPTSHALAKVVGDLHFIITQALVAAGSHPKSLDKLPPDLAFNVLWVYRDLNRAAASYQSIESKQPATRNCG